VILIYKKNPRKTKFKDQIPRIVTDISKIKNHKDHSMKNK
jgi:hypothetical protein